MKTLGAFLTLIALLSLVPAAFAVDSGTPAYQAGENRPMGSTTSNTSRSGDQGGRMTRNTSRSEGQVWHAGALRRSGLYIDLDGILHNVPKTQDPRMRIY